MSVDYPISFPVHDKPAPMILASATYKWEIGVNQRGAFEQYLLPSSATAGILKLLTPGGNVKAVTIDDSGILSTDDSSGSALSYKKLVGRTGFAWTMHTGNDGILYSQHTKRLNHGIMSVTFRARSVVAVSQSPFTLKQQIQIHGGQVWEADVRVGSMLRGDAAAWVGALVSLNGREGTFLLGDPDADEPQGTVDTIPAVDGANQEGTTLNIGGLSANLIGAFLSGDWFQLGSGDQTRLYMVVEDADSDANGKATLKIWPKLRESPAAGESVIITDPQGTFRLADNVREWDLNRTGLFGIEFKAVEAL